MTSHKRLLLQPKPLSAATPPSATNVVEVEDVHEASDGEEEPLLQTFECRICHEEDSVNNLETPCGCSGSLKYAHRKCIQHWCNEKGDISCEICHQFRLTSQATLLHLPSLMIQQSISVSGTTLQLRDPCILAMAAAERHLVEADYDEYADNNASGAAFSRSAALILMALLLLRHALYLTNGDDDNDEASAFFSLLLLRTAGFLLPCYVMARAISILQRRQQRQEAALAASEVAFSLQTGHRRGLQITIEPGPPASLHPGPVAPPQPSPASNVIQ